jgi:copper transport protein
VTLEHTVSRGRVVHRLALAVVLALAALTLLAPAASAHASLVSTDPAEGEVLAAAPETITLTFDEPVALSTDGATLYDASGQEVPAEARSVDRVVTVTPGGDLAEGTYVLGYRVISADSHPIAGSLSFSVGSPSETVVPPTDSAGTPDRGLVWVHGTLQGLTYTALLLATGLAFFAVLLLPASGGIETLRRRLRQVVRVAAVVAGAGATLLVPVGVAYQQGLGLTGLVTPAAWSRWASADGLLAALVVLGSAAVAVAVGERPPSPRQRIPVLAGGGVALAALALVGHTRSYGPTALVVLSDVAHVVAAATWFGGLVGLAITLTSLAKRETLAATTLARFSSVAAVLLAVVATAGVVLAWRVVGSWGGLLGTTYGLVLLAKVGVVALAVGVAGWNRFRLLPQVRRAVGYRDRTEAATRLRTAVRAEAGLLVVALLLTGFLVNQVPRETQTTEAVERATVVAVADDVKVVAHLQPGRVGTNTVTVQVQDATGEPVEPLAQPSISVGSESVDLGTRPARNVDSGTYQAQVVIPHPGTWEVQVSVRIGEFDNPVLRLETTVDEEGGR